MICRHYIVRGLVQGVFYRVATQQTALRLGLTGWVRNVSDGSVELIACGDPERLGELERWLWQGPPRAEVESVTVNEAALQAFTGFNIAH